MKKENFEDYLQTQCTEEGGYEGVLDDGYEDAFDAWLDTKGVTDIMEYADKAIQLVKENKPLDGIPF